MEGEEEYSVEMHDVEDRDEDVNHVGSSTEMSLRHPFTSNCEGLRTECKEVRTQVGKATDDITYLVAEEVAKTTTHKKTNVKDVVDALLGPRALCSI